MIDRPVSAQNDGALDDLRRNIDAVDGDLLRLLRRRLRIAADIAAVKRRRGAGGVTLRPEREAQILHRLSQERGSLLSLGGVLGVWRQIFALMNALQNPLSLHLHRSSQGDAEATVDVARAYYGFASPLHIHDSVDAMIETLAERNDAIGIAAFDDDRDDARSAPAWWTSPTIGAPIGAPPIENDATPPPLRIIDLIPEPFDFPPRSGSAATPRLAVLARAPAAASGFDRTLMVVETPASQPPEALEATLAALALSGRRRASSASPSDDSTRCTLIDLDGFIAADDPAPQRRRRSLNLADARCAIIGHYAAPFAAPSSEKAIPTTPRARDAALAVTPYKPGGGGRGEKGCKLSANENPLGAGAMARQALGAAAPNIGVYPDPTASGLRRALGRRFNLDPDRILCGAGSDEIFSLIAQAYLPAGSEAIMTVHSFEAFRIVTRAAGGVPVFTPEPDMIADPDAIVKAVNDDTRLVFLANPGNPAGTMLDRNAVAALHRRLRPDILLILDGAYADYVEDPNYESGLELAQDAENIVATRTFSKLHGLAGLRIGWGYASRRIIDVLNRIRGPFNTSDAAQQAAVVALDDRDHIAASLALNREWRERMSVELRALGLHVTPSVANFLLIGFPPQKGKSAADADRALKAQGLIVRRLENYGLPDHLRISIGLPESNRAVLACLQRFTTSQAP